MKSYKAYYDRYLELAAEQNKLEIHLSLAYVEHSIDPKTPYKDFPEEIWSIKERLFVIKTQIETIKPWMKAAHDLTTTHFMDEQGHLLEYAWPGGYTIIYQDKHGSVLCPTCANDLGNDERDLFFDFPPIAGDNYQEGPPIECDGGCGKMIESDYGNPSEKEEEHDA